ncbi:MAG TPA: hypothetical protein DDW76_05140 [Cyanobacteria bacterium UBA11369]|nr:hypothetical protein [Cyanobacteria bacterium UBA11371]HBE31783.1 hypothetical protein [Cyanobacteria bacterium UBA11368]HBE48192.1 hypothetical protein [Cyanobacteria bacterium UBA11369]
MTGDYGARDARKQRVRCGCPPKYVVNFSAKILIAAFQVLWEAVGHGKTWGLTDRDLFTFARGRNIVNLSVAEEADRS